MPKVLCACGRIVDTKPEWGGQWISCPGCQGTLYAPYPGDKPAPPVPVIEIAAPPPPAPPPPPTLPASAPTRLCPWCAETIPVSSTLCPCCKGDPTVGPSGGTAIRRSPTGAASSNDDGGWLPLVLGIVGFMFCQLLAPVAWAVGSTYEKKCRAAGRAPSSAGTAGKILGIVGTVFLFLMLAFFVLSIVIQA